MNNYQNQLKIILINIAYLLENPIEEEVIKKLKLSSEDNSKKFRETVNNLVGLVKEDELHIHVKIMAMVNEREHAWRNLRHDYAVELFNIKINSREII